MYLLEIVRHCTSSGLLKAVIGFCSFLEAYLPSRNQVDAMDLMAVL